MNLEQYSEKSFAVYGNTKPYAQYLKDLGGKFNQNLKSGPGWIFPLNKQMDVVNFVEMANNNTLPLTPNTSNYSSFNSFNATPLTPFNGNPNTMTPNNALERLKMSFNSNLPKINPIVPKSSSDVYPMGPATTAPTTVSYPNIFKAADNLTYQIIMYTVVYPIIGQQLTIKVGEQEYEYTVNEIKSNTGPIDDIIIKDNQEILSKLVILNGKWQVHHMKDEHTIIFK